MTYGAFFADRATGPTTHLGTSYTLSSRSPEAENVLSIGEARVYDSKRFSTSGAVVFALPRLR
jgi:hypothetical protein